MIHTYIYIYCIYTVCVYIYIYIPQAGYLELDSTLYVDRLAAGSQVGNLRRSKTLVARPQLSSIVLSSLMF